MGRRKTHAAAKRTRKTKRTNSRRPRKSRSSRGKTARARWGKGRGHRKPRYGAPVAPGADMFVTPAQRGNASFQIDSKPLGRFECGCSSMRDVA